MSKSIATNKFKYLRVAAITPKLKVGDINYNTKEIIKLATEAVSKGVQIMVFPELCITGYTLGDLFHQQLVLAEAQKALWSGKRGFLNGLAKNTLKLK